MQKYICIHAHFYQPPRENPWLEEVEQQDSAYPYHDWNERITAECYAPNTASRIVDSDNHIIDLINNYSKISFNVGPTLCAWMERHKPDVLEAIVAADRMSRERFSGHGGAIAQVYNHMIMPLANRRDKYTQVYWGVLDFEKRFGRYPEGMWLPETAVDIETLEVLAELNMRFTILAPYQARRFAEISPNPYWHETHGHIDPTMPYRCELPSGRSINLFFYDKNISQDMAFANLLLNGQDFAQRLLAAFHHDPPWPQIVNVATDGESYGHHSPHGDMALAYCLHSIESRPDVGLTTFGEYLERHPPTRCVEIVENTSWSCVHGIERWRSDCGCNSGRPGWRQTWRAPLRQAMDTLRDSIEPHFEREASRYLHDPWRARNEYYQVVQDRSREAVGRFLHQHGRRAFSQEEMVTILRLLELQRNCMLMYTSCGWFFDEISGIETTQVLSYAAKAIQDAEAVFQSPLEETFENMLATAPSNVLENGAAAYRLYAKMASLDLLRVGAHYGISSLFSDHKPLASLYCYTVESLIYRKLEAGKFKLAIGRTRVTSNLSWESADISFAVLHFGDHNINGGVRIYMGDEAFATMLKETVSAFERGNMTEILQRMVSHFGTNNYSLWHLFRDEQRRVLGEILDGTMQGVTFSLTRMYDEYYPVMSFLQTLRYPVPPPILFAAEYVVNNSLMGLFDDPEVDMHRLEQLVQQSVKWSFKLRRDELQLRISLWLTKEGEIFLKAPYEIHSLETFVRVLEIITPLGFELDLWRLQNIYFQLARKAYPQQREKAQAGDPVANNWVSLFTRLGSLLKVKVE